jgi:hypothetical protein
MKKHINRKEERIENKKKSVRAKEQRRYVFGLHPSFGSTRSNSTVGISWAISSSFLKNCYVIVLLAHGL